MESNRMVTIKHKYQQMADSIYLFVQAVKMKFHKFVFHLWPKDMFCSQCYDLLRKGNRRHNAKGEQNAQQAIQSKSTTSYVLNKTALFDMEIYVDIQRVHTLMSVYM